MIQVVVIIRGKEELNRMLAEDELRHAILLVFANKQDLPNAMSVHAVTERLRLNQLRNRKWYIQATCATTGDGWYKGLDWLSNTFKMCYGRKKCSTTLTSSFFPAFTAFKLHSLHSELHSLHSSCIHCIHCIQIFEVCIHCIHCIRTVRPKHTLLF